MLVTLVAGDDEDVATVACYDIGEFVRHYPNGRAIAKRLGAKDIIMQMIEHDNEELRRQALTCVSKMMVQNWSVSLIRLLTTETRDTVNITDDFLSAQAIK
jgi:V-type H+-transporting ATPase subunit H